MPFSQSGQLSAIVRFAEQLQPSSVLDVGTGMGQYGLLLRNNLENVNLFDVEKGVQRPRSEWKVRIDGIEGFPAYRTPVHDHAYQHIWWDHAQNRLPLIASGSYELVICIDVLEHFDKPEGEQVLRELRRIASRAVLISTPKDFHAQEVEANPLENHRSHWSEQELAALGYDQILPDAESWIAVAKHPEGRNAP